MQGDGGILSVSFMCVKQNVWSDDEFRGDLKHCIEGFTISWLEAVP